MLIITRLVLLGLEDEARSGRGEGRGNIMMKEENTYTYTHIHTNISSPKPIKPGSLTSFILHLPSSIVSNLIYNNINKYAHF